MWTWNLRDSQAFLFFVGVGPLSFSFLGWGIPVQEEVSDAGGVGAVNAGRMDLISVSSCSSLKSTRLDCKEYNQLGHSHGTFGEITWSFLLLSFSTCSMTGPSHLARKSRCSSGVPCRGASSSMMLTL